LEHIKQIQAPRGSGSSSSGLSTPEGEHKKKVFSYIWGCRKSEV